MDMDYDMVMAFMKVMATDMVIPSMGHMGMGRIIISIIRKTRGVER